MDEPTGDGDARLLGELEVWGDPLPPEALPPSRAAWYATKWRRRLPKVVIAVSLLLLLGPFIGLVALGGVDVGLPSLQYLWIPAVVVIGFVLVLSLVLTTLLAFVWGRQVTAQERRRSTRILWSIAVALTVVLAGASAWWVRPPGTVQPRTVASEKEGSHVYLAVLEEANADGASGAGLDRYLRPLEAASRAHAPALVADLQHYFDGEGWRGANATTGALTRRCVDAGWLSTGDLDDFDRRMAQIEADRS